MKKLRDIVIEALSDLRSTHQKMQDLHDHPNTEPHLKSAAKAWLDRHGPAKPSSTFDDRDFGRWNTKKSTYKSRPEPKPKPTSDPDSHKYYDKAAKSYHYSYKGTTSDTSGSPEEDHTVHHYHHMKGHKIELHMDPEQNHVDHWYHINNAHKATKGKGFENFGDHIRDEYHKQWSQ
jgi:hypothetical protein